MIHWARNAVLPDPSIKEIVPAERSGISGKRKEISRCEAQWSVAQCFGGSFLDFFERSMMKA